MAMILLRLVAAAFFLVAACEMPLAGPPPVLTQRIVTTNDVVDDGRLHFFRTYYALEEVGRFAHHYDAWYLDVEQSHCHIVVVDGKATVTGSDWGGLSARPAKLEAIPEGQASEAELVERTVERRYPNAKRVQIAYEGAYRRLVISDMHVVTNATMVDKPIGWHGRTILKADESLTRIEGQASGITSHGYGMIDIAKGSARLAAPDTALATARDIVAGRPVASFDALLASPHDATLPEGYDQPVSLHVSVFGRHEKPDEQVARDLQLPLHPRSAAKDGKTTASTKTDIDGTPIEVTATMTAFAPSANKARKQLAQEGEDMEATLDIALDDGRGNSIHRSYKARGKVVVQGLAIALPSGLELPGTSTPSAEADALKFTWPGNGTSRSIDIYVDPVMWAAPPY